MQEVPHIYIAGEKNLATFMKMQVLNLIQ